VDVAGRTVLVRSDLNVPLDNGGVGDDFRIRMALGTITRLRQPGRRWWSAPTSAAPKGVDPAFSLAPVAARMSELAGYPVTHVDATVGATRRHRRRQPAGGGDVRAVGEHPVRAGETKNDDTVWPTSSPACATCSCRTPSARCTGRTPPRSEWPSGSSRWPGRCSWPSWPLGRFLGDTERPYVVILGGAKISDKLGRDPQSAAPHRHDAHRRRDVLHVHEGPGGTKSGSSLVEDDMVERCARCSAGERRHKIRLPGDIVIADRFAEDADHRTVAAGDIPDGDDGSRHRPGHRRDSPR
jgi:phosphoglycerate kinase